MLESQNICKYPERSEFGFYEKTEKKKEIHSLIELIFYSLAVQQYLSFNCNLCILNFSSRNDRNEHIRQHFKQKPCATCNKILFQIGDHWYELKLHIDENCHVAENTSSDELGGLGESDIKIEQNNEGWTASAYKTGNDCRSTTLHSEPTAEDCVKKEPFELCEVAPAEGTLFDSKVCINQIETDCVDENEIKVDAVDSDSDNGSDDEVDSQQESSSHIDSSLIECEICHKSVSKRGHKRHLETVHNTRFSYKCRVCEEPYQNKKDLKKHVTEKHQGRGYSCEFCGKTYRDKYGVHRHKESTHFRSDKVSCNVCHKEMQKDYLVKHMQIHTDRNKFKCEKCGKMFHSERGLKEHIQVFHEGSKLYQCETCGKNFANSGNLKVHKNLHSEIRPFICSYCGRGFNQESNLKEHVNTHTGLKPYACKVCGKTFTQSRQLSAHMRIHTRHRPYKCKIGDCDRAYINAIDMKRHRFSVHGVYTKKHVCHICSKVYPEKKMLTKHLLSH